MFNPLHIHHAGVEGGGQAGLSSLNPYRLPWSQEIRINENLTLIGAFIHIEDIYRYIFRICYPTNQNEANYVEVKPEEIKRYTLTDIQIST